MVNKTNTSLDWQGQNAVLLEGCFLHHVNFKRDAIAVQTKEASLTYRDLDTQSNQLAHALIAQGIKRGDRVAISLCRTPELVVALIAIFKVGAAYVPLDPIYPYERIKYMLDDCEAAYLVCRNEEAVRFGALLPTLNLDTIDLTQYPITTPSTTITPQDLAYIIYTSGSTGNPKGVMIGHQSLSNLLCSMRLAPSFSESDVMFAVSTICFDISVPDIFLPLLCGGKTYLCSEDTIRNPKILLQELAASGATVMQATPVLWSLMIDAGWPRTQTNFKILSGGEAMPPDLGRELLARGQVWNMYGPTETTVWSSAMRVRDEDVSGEHLVCPIGLPLHNTQFYVLDEQQNEVPHGEKGELCIGGAGLAQGYWKKPFLTQEKFINGLYRTSDCVKRLPDGRLAFLGRLDHQVKLHGYRIELDEISLTAKRHPSVKAAVALLREHPTRSHLQLFIVANDTLETSVLRDFLKLHLPRYMVPAKITLIPTLPLTPNGKTDRAALKALQPA